MVQPLKGTVIGKHPISPTIHFGESNTIEHNLESINTLSYISQKNAGHQHACLFKKYERFFIIGFGNLTRFEIVLPVHIPPIVGFRGLECMFTVDWNLKPGTTWYLYCFASLYI